jgi:arginyl-tRNA synthetase
MLSLVENLESKVKAWAEKRLDRIPGHGPLVQPCQNPEFGHLQSNVAMMAAKQAGLAPRELAAELVEWCSGDPMIEKPEVAGPGFVNFRFKTEALESALADLIDDPRLGVQPPQTTQTVVIDFSSPNVAKEMHVGHIRSTILGESLARILEFQGHNIIRDNHIGDWGTQFGKIILGLKRNQITLDAENALSTLEEVYREIHAESENNEETLNQARAELKKLQDGDPENKALWESIRHYSQEAFDQIYRRLDVTFDHTLGESFYNPVLKETVDRLRQKGLARESEGATVVFFDEDDLKEHPMLVEKSDGAALYSTTDIATLQYRTGEWKADRIVYVTDGRQQLHFRQLFKVAEMLELDVELEHVWFGSILDKSKKPLKTRDGTPLRLRALLDEAEERSAAILAEKRPDLDATSREKMASVIGIGALKYADLAQNRNLDYVFDWDKLLSFDGNTAPYLINAYVRTRSILRKAGATSLPEDKVTIRLDHPVEQALAWHLLGFAEIVELAGLEQRPHYICNHLHQTATLFHRFFEHCPVLRAESDDLKASRLELSRLTGHVIKTGLHLLGIETLEEM